MPLLIESDKSQFGWEMLSVILIFASADAAPAIAYQIRGQRVGYVVWAWAGDALAAKQAALLAGDRSAVVINLNSFWPGLVAGVLSAVVLLAIVFLVLTPRRLVTGLLAVSSPEDLFTSVMLYAILTELLVIPVFFLKKGSPEFYILFWLAGLLISTLFLRAANLGIGMALTGFFLVCFLLSMLFKK
ncbi:hypothetical protein [cf. Phormidesmis sp. LEGE 11477]|uniref:hypothetical protein n=1 Tax=cf. Phormidesmis sp. LEGE 11477 TaxID=1828680 RepID=UPI00187F8D51|nr:hypothetical protein [cf. Phormidesmis sp. LEGE 11477]MBE9063432.1 hypothetical protein [cf. Phormidesmis sp. LEGE 11477]